MPLVPANRGKAYWTSSPLNKKPGLNSVGRKRTDARSRVENVHHEDWGGNVASSPYLRGSERATHEEKAESEDEEEVETDERLVPHYKAPRGGWVWTIVGDRKAGRLQGY